MRKYKVDKLQILFSRYQEKYPLHRTEVIIDKMLKDGVITFEDAKNLQEGKSIFSFGNNWFYDAYSGITMTQIMGGYFNNEETKTSQKLVEESIAQNKNNVNIETTYLPDGRVFSVNNGTTSTIYRYDNNGKQYVRSILELNSGNCTYYRKDGSVDYIEDNIHKETRFYDKDGNLKRILNNKYLEQQDGKIYSAETIANNLRIIYDGCLEDWSNKDKYLKEMLRNINNKNILEVLKENSKTDSTNNLFSNFDKEYWGNDKKQILKEKFNQLIEYAKNNNIYIKDFEEKFVMLYTKNDLKYLARAMDRITERILISLDTNEYRASKRKKDIVAPNGELDSDFAQGYTSDCWLLSAIASAKNDSNLLYKLDKSLGIKYEIDGKTLKEIKVCIQGKDYIISAEELHGAVEYATGDLDVRAVEIAVNRFFSENNMGDIDDGKRSIEGLKILFGERYEIQNFGKANDEFIENMRNGKYMCAVAGSHVDIDSDDETETGYYGLDANGNKIPIYNRHGYSVVKADEKYIYIVNPWDSNTILRVTLDNFKKIFCGNTSISVIKK